MRLDVRSSLPEVVACVAARLAESRIRAVLTGGACASIHTGGAYQSSDLDFVLRSSATKRQLDEVMAKIGFHRAGEHYEHPESIFFVEFPAGPLGIGTDIEIRPVAIEIKGVRVMVLTATDSCRDRLAAFYHWKDRQSLVTAVQIACKKRVNLRKVRAWSVNEGALSAFEEFLEELGRAKKQDRDE